MNSSNAQPQTTRAQAISAEPSALVACAKIIGPKWLTRPDHSSGENRRSVEMYKSSEPNKKKSCGGSVGRIERTNAATVFTNHSRVAGLCLVVPMFARDLMPIGLMVRLFGSDEFLEACFIED